MLAGQDPLAAAIAAGETPSPELVAAAGETRGAAAGARVGVPRRWSCVAALLVPWLRPRTSLIGRISVEKSPAALEDRARELLARLGAAPGPADSEVGFRVDDAYFRWTETRDRSPSRWDSLRTGDPPVVQFFYRQSPQPLVARASYGEVTWREPPVDVSDMAGVRYDLRGRLLGLYVVPPQVEEPATPPGTGSAEPDWRALFDEARLEITSFERVASVRTPPFYVETRASWKGYWPSRPDVPIRVEAAAYRGRPVWFEIVSPWTRAERSQPWQPSRGHRMTRALGLVLAVVLTAAGGFLARRNTRLGRGDRRGAARLAFTVALLTISSWVLRAHHVADPGSEFGLAARAAGVAVLLSVLLWLFYLALEPYVRRLRPWTLVSWTRVLNGGAADAVVGRDALVGMTWGALLSLSLVAGGLVPAWLGRAPRAPLAVSLEVLLGTRMLLANVLGAPVDATLFGLGTLLLFLILRFVTRSDAAAAALIVAILTLSQVGEVGDTLWLVVPYALVVFASYVALLLRFGVLAVIVGIYTANLLLHPNHSWAFGSWTASATPFLLLLLVGLALFAFRTALGGRAVLRGLTGPDPSSSGSR